ncbi:MAG: hypothetical protein QOE05_117 [Actinomycetota bacterium]|nr:hypothetical protein [Actinomycetota bacterium]
MLALTGVEDRDAHQDAHASAQQTRGSCHAVGMTTEALRQATE